MPFITIRVTEGVSAEDKARLIKGATDLVVEVLDKNPASTHVIVEEVPTDNWGIKGQTVTALRQKS